jgi:hypothetical protein
MSGAEKEVAERVGFEHFGRSMRISKLPILQSTAIPRNPLRSPYFPPDLPPAQLIAAELKGDSPPHAAVSERPLSGRSSLLGGGNLVTPRLFGGANADPKPKFAGKTGDEQSCAPIASWFPVTRHLQDYRGND